MNFREYKNNKKEMFIKSKPEMHNLTLTGKFERRKAMFVEAVCSCGSIRWYRLNSIERAGTKSCGCMEYTGNGIRKEASFFNMLELLLDGLHEVKRQYFIKGYRIDAYIPDLNIALEYDERFHRYQKSDDEKREFNIKSELNCTFIRLLDEDSHLINLKKVMEGLKEYKKIGKTVYSYREVQERYNKMSSDYYEKGVK